MDINNVDYSKYSIEDLLRVKTSIDPEKAGQNYNNLCNEFERRKDDIELYLSKINSKRNIKNNVIVFILALFQFASGGVIAYLLYLNMPVDKESILFISTVVVIAINALAALLISFKIKFGFNLTFLNLLLQLITFNTGAIFYSYNSVAHLFIKVEDKISFLVEYNPGISVVWNNVSGTAFYSVNLLAILGIVLLFNTIEFNKD